MKSPLERVDMKLQLNGADSTPRLDRAPAS